MDKKKYLKNERDKIIQGLEETYKRLISFKRKMNNSLIISKNGKVIAINANDLPTQTAYLK